jgi:hypothetical protein
MKKFAFACSPPRLEGQNSQPQFLKVRKAQWACLLLRDWLYIVVVFCQLRGCLNDRRLNELKHRLIKRTQMFSRRSCSSRLEDY